MKFANASPRPVVFLLLSVSVMLAGRARGVCTYPPIPPTVSIEVSDHAPNGDLYFRITYSFPGTDSSGRALRFLDNGSVISYLDIDPGGSGVATFGPWSVSCRTGVQTFSAQAWSVCQGTSSPTVTNSVAVFVNPKPSVELSYSEQTGEAIVKYNFPNTNNHRFLALYVDGAFWASASPGLVSGTWTYPVGTCWKNLRVKATACNQGANPGFTDEKTLDQSDKTENVTVALLKAGAGLIEATIQWAGVNAGSTINLKLQNWTNAAGQQIAGGSLGGIVAQAASGTDDITFAAPTGARQLSVVASASTACGVVTDDASLPCDECDATGNPVYWSDGNMRLTDGEPLPAIGGNRLVRTYDSDEQAGGLFGRGWTTLFESRLIAHSDGAISILNNTNEVVTFRTILGVYRQTWPESDRSVGTLVYNSSAGTYTYRAAGATETTVFRATDGRLLTLRDSANAREASITYDAQGRPVTFTDLITGVSWNLTVNGNRRVTSIAVAENPALTWTYTYDANDNLMSVLAPGNATWRTYEYANNRMTASYDALGNLIESHTYDADGYAITSTGDIDEITNIEYGLPGADPRDRVTRVTYRTGATADYTLRAVGSAWRPVLIAGGCATCGTHDTTLVRDTRGRPIREQGVDGYITVRTYAGGRVQSEERPLEPDGCNPRADPLHCRLGPDALATATLKTIGGVTVKTTYAYADALWPDKVTTQTRPSIAAAEKLRQEAYTYHAVTGAMSSTLVQGWVDEETPRDRVTRTIFYGEVVSCGQPQCPPDDPYEPAFAPGGSFLSAWLTLPQPQHLPKSIDGPRTDVQDIHSLVYYPIDATVPALLRGRLAATKNAAGHITRYENYDVFGNVTRTVDPNGVATEAVFDSLGRLTESTTKGIPGCDTTSDPLCATDITATRTYEAAGPLQYEHRPGGGVTAYTYDARGRIHTVSRGPAETDLREQIETSYDPLTGKKSLERTLAYEAGVWQENQRQSFDYDSEARLQTVTHADGASIQYAYDAANRVSTVRDENHTQPNTMYAYDPAGRLESVKQTLAGAPDGVITTSYTYDTDGNLSTVTDPNGNATTYTYDDLGQMRSQVSPVTGTTTYSYDDAGNLKDMKDANGGLTTRAHDALNRVISATSTRESNTEIVSWSYDDPTAGRFGIGHLTTMTDPSGSTDYHYERRGLLREETRTINGAAYTYTTGFRYDADGNRAIIHYPSTLLTVEYGFDYAGRPTSVSGVVTDAFYLPFGPLAVINFTNGTSQQMAFDTRYRQQGNLLYDGTGLEPGLIAGYGYDHDAVGNITLIGDLTDDGYNRTFAYDDLNRLVTAHTGTALWRSGIYTWDKMGNILSIKLGEIEKGPTDPLDLARDRRDRIRVQENIPRGRSLEFSYSNAPDPVDPEDEPAPTPSARVTAVTTNGVKRRVAHDFAGNETSYVATRAYSPRNLLSSVTDTGEPGDPLQHKLEYTYDGRGIRVIRKESPADGPNTASRRFFIYSPELQLLAATHDDAPTVWGMSAADKNIRYEIVWFAGRPIAQITPGGPRKFTFTDHLGTPILQTDATAAVIWRAEYEPFGNIYEMREGTRADQPLRFPGQDVAMTWEGQEENYNIFRWYRSGWGRYTQADPLSMGALSVGNALPAYDEYVPPREYTYRLYAPQRQQAYGYATGMPTRAVDPMGLFSAGDLAKIGGVCALADGPEPFIGDAIGAVLVAGAIVWGAAEAIDNIIDQAKSKCDKCEQKKCRPCEPPAGTIGYQIHAGHTHYPYGDPHLKLWHVNQDPKTCKCFWNSLGYSNPPPPPGAVPYTGVVGGGGFL